LSEPDRNGISAKLRRLPGEFLLALINGTAILVIVAAILVLVAMVRIDNFAGNVVATMTEAALSKIDLPSKEVLANLRNLTEEVRTLGTALREIKTGENPVLQSEIARLKEALDRPQCERRSARKREDDPHRRSDWAARPVGHRDANKDEGLRFQHWPNAASSHARQQRGRISGHYRLAIKMAAYGQDERWADHRRISAPLLRK
jgi:hypothetical protein